MGWIRYGELGVDLRSAAREEGNRDVVGVEGVMDLGADK